MTAQKVRALDTREVADLAGIPISTLNSWSASKLCLPSLLGPAGHRVTRFWHPKDVVAARALRALRNAGCSMQKLRNVQRLINTQWDSDMSDLYLIYDGNDVFVASDLEARVMSAIRNPGQAAFPLAMNVAALPISVWIAQAKFLGAEVNIAAERAARHKRQIAREKAAETRRLLIPGDARVG